MSVRFRHALLIALLLLGQAGAWLHGLGHHLEPLAPGVSLEAGAGDDDASAGHGHGDVLAAVDVCLVCLTAAALALALWTAVQAYLAPGRTPCGPGTFLIPPAHWRDLAQSARGPPARS